MVNKHAQVRTMIMTRKITTTMTMIMIMIMMMMMMMRMMRMMRGRDDDGVYHCKNNGLMKIAIFLMARLRFKFIILLVSWYLVVPWSSNPLGLGSDHKTHLESCSLNQIMGGWGFSRKLFIGRGSDRLVV